MYDEDRYDIIKFFDAKDRGPVVQRGYGTVTLKRAQKICSDPSTSTNGKKPYGKNWFLGYSKAGRY